MTAERRVYVRAARPALSEIQEGGPCGPSPYSTIEFITVYGLWYAVSPLKGGTTYGQCTIPRCAGPSYRVPGFHQPDPRRVSATASALRGRVPSPYGHVAP